MMMMMVYVCWVVDVEIWWAFLRPFRVGVGGMWVWVELIGGWLIRISIWIYTYIYESR